MPKAEKGSLKDIGKRIKAKGLQKLKFYCQMCQKQCRDANGFKCHLTSDSHLQQMKIFSSHAKSFMDQYSKEFEKLFLDTLRMRHTTCQVAANVVYQEVIQDRSHIHMNATIWATLTDFVQYLGKTGQCVVEDTERGWYITYIERNTSKLMAAERTQQRLIAEQAAEQAAQERIEQQRVAAAQALERVADRSGHSATGPTPLERDTATDAVTVALKKPSAKAKKAVIHKSIFEEEENDEDDDAILPPPAPQNGDTQPERASDQGLTVPPPQAVRTSHPAKEALAAKDPNQGDSWLYPNIMVRIINETLGNGRYFRRKGVVDKVVDPFLAQVRVLDDDDDDQGRRPGDLLQLDQDDLETVAPKRVSERVCIVRGKYRGRYGTVLTLDKKHYRADIALNQEEDRRAASKVLSRVDYDDFSKVNESSNK